MPLPAMKSPPGDLVGETLPNVVAADAPLEATDSAARPAPIRSVLRIMCEPLSWRLSGNPTPPAGCARGPRTNEMTGWLGYIPPSFAPLLGLGSSSITYPPPLRCVMLHV